MLGVYLGHPLRSGFVSGGERRFVEVCRRLEAFGFEPWVLTTSTGEEALEQNNVVVHKYVVPVFLESILQKSIILYLLVGMFRSIFLILRMKRSFHVIVSSSHFLFDILPAVIVSRRNQESKLVVYLHHLEPPPFERAKYHRLLPSFFTWFSQSICLRLIAKYAHIVFINALDIEEIRKFGVPEERIRIMYQGIDSKKIQEITREKDDFSACFLGRLSPFKGIFDLIFIWENVCQKFPDARVAVIGSEIEKYVSQLKSKIERNKMQNNIILFGVLGEDKKYSVLKASKTFVFPSYEEGWGIAVCEAMACGLPVVAYDLPAYKVFKDAILKVPRGDKEAFTEKVLELLSHENLRFEICRKAEHAAIQFDWNKVLEEEIKILSEGFA